ncbi:protein DPCD isoform X3 [Cryptotermes secundus]|uniref:protein DPCD isoform X3 n=1 Tax=Cryptotermes secundus TaxID=105785 RepID=UPI000CD7D9AA|nr:protein DPCD isoform X3 [Cryptotermes secundus]
MMTQSIWVWVCVCTNVYCTLTMMLSEYLHTSGKQKVHYQFSPAEEMVEEYNWETGVLIRRAWRKKNTFGGEGQWDVEIGDPETRFLNLNQVGIKESSSAPFVSRRITKTSLEWRIRNLPYPLSVYTVKAEPESKCITVRTTNKKYFKKLAVPDLERAGLLPEQDKIQFTHKHNTLIITYQKPPEVYGLEKKVLQELKKIKPCKEGDMQCNPS